jgi:hypothetical protein
MSEIIPKYWVTMTDRFMSGWGLAKGLKNKLVFECESLAEAEKVEAFALNRPEMSYVHLCSRKPKYVKAVMEQDYKSGGYYVQMRNKTLCPRWYE